MPKSPSILTLFLTAHNTNKTHLRNGYDPLFFQGVGWDVFADVCANMAQVDHLTGTNCDSRTGVG